MAVRGIAPVLDAGGTTEHVKLKQHWATFEQGDPAGRQFWATTVFRVVEMNNRTAVRGIVIDRSGWPADGTGGKTPPNNMGVYFNPDGCSDPAHEESTPVPMVNNAIASAHAAVVKVFASVVRSNIVDLSFSERRFCSVVFLVA